MPASVLAEAEGHRARGAQLFGSGALQEALGEFQAGAVMLAPGPYALSTEAGILGGKCASNSLLCQLRLKLARARNKVSGVMMELAPDTA